MHNSEGPHHKHYQQLSLQDLTLRMGQKYVTEVTGENRII